MVALRTTRNSEGCIATTAMKTTMITAIAMKTIFSMMNSPFWIEVCRIPVQRRAGETLQALRPW
jgi:hypothetical protein